MNLWWIQWGAKFIKYLIQNITYQDDVMEITTDPSNNLLNLSQKVILEITKHFNLPNERYSRWFTTQCKCKNLFTRLNILHEQKYKSTLIPKNLRQIEIINADVDEGKIVTNVHKIAAIMTHSTTKHQQKIFHWWAISFDREQTHIYMNS